MNMNSKTKYDYMYDYLSAKYEYINFNMKSNEYREVIDTTLEYVEYDNYSLLVRLNSQETLDLINKCKSNGNNYIETYMLLK